MNNKSTNSLYGAIFAASAKVREPKNTKQVLLVISDGENNPSDHSYKDLRTHLRSVNLPVYSISFSNNGRQVSGYYDLYRNRNRQTLDEICKTSGGQAFERTIQNRFSLFGIFKKVLAEVENQYVIGFYPEAPDGKWHELKVMVKAPNGKKYRLSNREGYLSQKTTQTD